MNQGTQSKSIVLLLAGSLLIGLNIFGMFQTLHVPTDSLNPFFGVADRTIERLSSKELDRREGESDSRYFKRLSASVSNYIIHSWEDSGTYPENRSRNLLIPYWENYPLRIVQEFARFYYGKAKVWELYDVDKILERGIGLCSQASILVERTLETNGYQAFDVFLDGHVVVTTIDRNGKEWLIDADYGLAIPHSLKELEESPELRLQHYVMDAQPLSTAFMADRRNIIKTFDPPNLVRSDRDTAKRYIEQATYWLKWIIPFLFLALGAHYFRRDNC